MARNGYANMFTLFDLIWCLVCEEQRQLLGTEEESSDRHSSSEETESESIWTITDEQRKYYTTQFQSLQPKPSGVVPGPVARLFFEKSRLPVQELRQIWFVSCVGYTHGLFRNSTGSWLM